MKNIYNPDYWVILKVTKKDNNQNVHYRILAGWVGSYMYGSSWKISSGIVTFEDVGESYKSAQSTGSIYVLNKNSEHMNSIMQAELDYQNQNSNYSVDTITVDRYLKLNLHDKIDQVIQKDFDKKAESF